MAEDPGVPHDDSEVHVSELQTLHDLALAAARCRTMAELATTATEAAASVASVTNVGIAQIIERDRTVRVYQGPTGTWGVSEIRLVDLDDETPLTDVARSGTPVIVRSEAEFDRRYPSIARRIEPGDVTSMSTYPLFRDGTVIGSCFFRFSRGDELTPEREWLIERMVELIALSAVWIADREELVDYADRLEQSNRDLDNFAAVVAHDLAGPVRRISSFLQLLLRQVGPIDATTQRYATTVTDQMAHLDALLRDTLAYSQVVTPSDRREPVQLATIAHDVVSSMESELSEIDATVEVGDLPMVDVDRALVRQVFQNLVDNAIKYRSVDRPPTVTISAAPESLDDPWWRVSVVDNGIGIDPARSSEVFAMFARLEPSSELPGTGVGLAFVKRVVERHGGVVGVDSRPGIGSTFWFTLPGVASPDIL